MHKFGGSEQFDTYMEDIRHQQEVLRREAQEFKSHSRQAVNVLKTKNLSIEAYTAAVALMQEMAEDICTSGPSTLEYWAQRYADSYQLQLSGAKTIEDVLKNSRERAKQEHTLYQIRPVDWVKLK